MEQIARKIIKLKCREKFFLYFSYLANIIVISILLMIATGIKNITNETLNSNDLKQIESILSSVILVSILAVGFFQWIISMQFRALFISRQQFNNIIRLMGAPESFLLKVYIREMISMQPPVLICGIVSAEAIYYILSGIFGGGQRYIGLPQIIVSVFVHIAVISLSVALTYFKMIKRSVVYEIRGKESNQALAVLTKKNRVWLVFGTVLFIISFGASLMGEDGGDVQSYGYFGELIAIFIVLDPLMLLLHSTVLKVAKKAGAKAVVFAESVTLGYIKKSSVVCSMVLFSTMMFLGLQMLYRNVRFAGADTVEARVHYAATVWYDKPQKTENMTDAQYNALKFKCKKGESTWYINGIDSGFVSNYEDVIIDEKYAAIADNLAGYLDDSGWDGIIMPNMYLQKGDIGKEITVNIDGKDIKFHVAGAYYSNNFAHLSFLVSGKYLRKMLGYDENDFNITYFKHESDLEKLKATAGTITETFADIRTESYEKAVSGTALVEMVSVVVILAAIFSLINFIMISSKEDTRDIAKLRGMGISKSEIYKIYGTYAVLSVLWSVAAAVPASILFAKIGCTMVFDAAYYLRPFILTPELMFILAVAFFGVSYTAQIIAIKNMAGSKEYINVIRDMNR